VFLGWRIRLVVGAVRKLEVIPYSTLTRGTWFLCYIPRSTVNNKMQRRSRAVMYAKESVQAGRNWVAVSSILLCVWATVRRLLSGPGILSFRPQHYIHALFGVYKVRSSTFLSDNLSPVNRLKAFNRPTSRRYVYCVRTFFEGFLHSVSTCVLYPTLFTPCG